MSKKKKKKTTRRKGNTPPKPPAGQGRRRPARARPKPDGRAQEIIKRLEGVASRSGRRPEETFIDWLQLVEKALDALPRHLRSLLAGEGLAEDDREAAAVWAHLRAKYPRREAWDAFAEAFAFLLPPSGDGDLLHRYMRGDEVLGRVYMELTSPRGARWRGQFFTPWHVAVAMAEVVGREENLRAEVTARLREALERAKEEPVAEAALVAGGLVIGAVQEKEPGTADFVFWEHVWPAVRPYYRPVRILDPCCGSGVLLLAMAEGQPLPFLRHGLVELWGIDIDPLCVQMTRVNLKVHGYPAAHIWCGDALGDPAKLRLGAAPPPYEAIYRQARALEAEEAARAEAAARFRRAAESNTRLQVQVEEGAA